MTNYYKKMKVFEDMNYQSSYAHNLSSCEIKPGKKNKKFRLERVSNPSRWLSHYAL